MRLWQSVLVNAITVVLIYSGFHTLRTSFTICILVFWVFPNLRSLHARLTHVQQVMTSYKGPFQAFFGVRGAAESMRDRTELYARWKIAATAWL